MVPSTVRVAVTQHEPEWLDLDSAVKKTCDIIKEAASGGAKLVAFPELWIPGYPAWIWSRPVDFELGVRYVQNSLRIDSPEMQRICDAAAQNGIQVSLGFSENDADSLYIAQALIGEDGKIKFRRRKLKPTHQERTIFGDASGECLNNVVDSPIGKVGSLACWEHIQPLLKYHTLAQKEQIHVAAWPVLDPFIQGSPGFWSMSVEGCRNLSQTYAVESQTFVLHCTTVITSKGVDLMKTNGSPLMGTDIVGSSAVFGPDGRQISPPATTNEQLIFADLDLASITKAKTFADASGHYSRPDMLWLGTDPTSKKLVKPVRTEAKSEDIASEVDGSA